MSNYKPEPFAAGDNEDDYECPCLDLGTAYDGVVVRPDGWAYCYECGAEWNVETGE